MLGPFLLLFVLMQHAAMPAKVDWTCGSYYGYSLMMNGPCFVHLHIEGFFCARDGIKGEMLMQRAYSHGRKQADAARVLVVDDDVLTRNYLSLLLQRWGYGVVTACDLSSARKALGDAVFSLTLIDLMYPGDDVSGFDLVELIRAQQPACAVMIITSDHTAETAVEAIRLRVDDYFLKPIKSKELLSAIQQLKDVSISANSEISAAGVAFSGLTLREKAVLQMFQQGYSYKETARILHCSVATVQTHAKHIYRKMGVHSRAEAAHEGLRLRLIKP